MLFNVLFLLYTLMYFIHKLHFQCKNALTDCSHLKIENIWCKFLTLSSAALLKQQQQSSDVMRVISGCLSDIWRVCHSKSFTIREIYNTQTNDEIIQCRFYLVFEYFKSIHFWHFYRCLMIYS